MTEEEKEPLWEKSEESLKIRIAFFIAGSIGSLALIVALFANKYSSAEFAITISIAGGLILISAIIIVVAVRVQRKEKNYSS